jgi:hypothetical protein
VCINTAGGLIARTGGGKIDLPVSGEELANIAVALQDQRSDEFGQAAVVAVMWSSAR